MGRWKFNHFEADVDFTDVDFLERIESAQEALPAELEAVPTEGKASEIIRAQIQCYDQFMNRIFGEGASGKMFVTNSLSERVSAVVSLKAEETSQEEAFQNADRKYMVKKGNRKQRRAQAKKHYNEG